VLVITHEIKVFAYVHFRVSSLHTRPLAFNSGLQNPKTPLPLEPYLALSVSWRQKPDQA